MGIRRYPYLGHIRKERMTLAIRVHAKGVYCSHPPPTHFWLKSTAPSPGPPPSHHHNNRPPELDRKRTKKGLQARRSQPSNISILGNCFSCGILYMRTYPKQTYLGTLRQGLRAEPKESKIGLLMIREPMTTSPSHSSSSNEARLFQSP